MYFRYDFRKYDFISILLITALFVISYYAIGSATRINSVEGTNYFANKQLIGFGVGFVLMLLISLVDYQIIGKLTPLIYIAIIVVLIVVIKTGVNAKGAVRWIEIGDFRIQPSEFAKVGMILVLAKYFDKFQDKINKIYIILGGLLILAVPFALVAKEDLSSSVVFLAIFAMMIYAAKISYKYVIPVLGLLLPGVYWLIWYIQQPDQKLLKGFQLKRILAFLNPQKYALSGALQTTNSVQAIGSGQLFGKGLYNGKLNQYDYLPEPQTDFIFSIIGEEFGFVGCILVLALLFGLMLHLLFLSGRSGDLMGRLIIVGYVAILLTQTFINVGVTTAIVPNTGLPLPYVSYGLSALWSNMMIMGVILNISIKKIQSNPEAIPVNRI